MNASTAHDFRYLSLLDAANTAVKVNSFTHSYYRYPARFGEYFVREAVAQFSRKGEIVLDPFCGGGTTLVEALVADRRVIGSDLSELAVFVARAKTSPLSGRQLDAIGEWLAKCTQSTSALLRRHVDANDFRLVGIPGQYRNLVAAMREQIGLLPKGDSQRFASCLLLKSCQWAFDGKQHVPSPSSLIDRLYLCFAEMRRGMEEYVAQLQLLGITKKDISLRRNLRICSAADLSLSKFQLRRPSVSLVVTSPPYLGVHVLYHRWQLQGRKELKAPFFVTRSEDLGGAASYTLVSRHSKTSDKYFSQISHSFSAIRGLLREKAYVVQLVSFSDAGHSLPRYLDALSSAGLQLCETYLHSTGELSWRSVPGRRWYARVGAVEDSSAAQEVLLVHRKEQ